MSVIDLSDSDDDIPTFNHNDWISRGKKYPIKNTPKQISRAKRDLLIIPSSHRQHIPAIDLPINSFLKLQLPQPSSQIILIKPKFWFSNNRPTTNVECLMTRPIPSEDFLKKLEEQLGQSWFDGMESITDPRYNDGKDRFPFWIISFWKELSNVTKKQLGWKKSKAWLDEQAKDTDPVLGESLAAAADLFNTLGWDTELPYLRGIPTTFTLSLILTWEWLTDDHIDIMMEDLAYRVSLDPELAEKVIVAPLAFSEAIKKSPKGGYTKEKTPLLYLYEKKIREGKIEKLYYPMHIHGNHWIAGVIDFKRKVFGFGEHGVRSCKEEAYFF